MGLTVRPYDIILFQQSYCIDYWIGERNNKLKEEPVNNDSIDSGDIGQVVLPYAEGLTQNLARISQKYHLHLPMVTKLTVS